MRITRGNLRKIIKEELSRLWEQAKEFAANRLRKRSKTLQGFGYDLGEIVEQKVEEKDV